MIFIDASGQRFRLGDSQVDQAEASWICFEDSKVRLNLHPGLKARGNLGTALCFD